MKVNIKKLCDEAVIPSYAHSTDAGLDLVATKKEYDDHGNVVYYTGIAVEIPEGHVGLLFPRSSVSKTPLYLTNSVGVIDAGYRGEITMKFFSKSFLVRPKSFIDRLRVVLFGTSAWRLNTQLIRDFFEADKHYNVGDRIGQLIIIPYPKIEFEEVSELGSSDRGEGGFGSTGK